MTPLSVVIITYNEAKNIARCLDAVQGIADEIIVVDSFSTDQTKSICEKYAVKFIEREWEGYSATKNFGNEQAKHNWVLSLDADEAPSEELKKSLLEWKKGKGFPASFNRLTNYCGQWIKYCAWYPDEKFRLFNKTNTFWEGSIHEELISSAHLPIQKLQGDLLHYSFYTVEEHQKQSRKFANMAAEDLFKRGKKSNWFLILLKTWAKFVRNFIVHKGFLDGKKGWIICKITAKETFLKYKRLKELRQR